MDMLTNKHIFRPAWLRTIGPGLFLAMLLSAAIVLAATRGLISPDVALRMHLIPNGLLLAFCGRWLLQGSVVVKPNQVVLQGWARTVDREGRKRFVQIQQSIPRSEWSSITVKGLFYATVTWSSEEETIVFERLGRPDLLRKLLAAPAARFDSLLSLGPLPLALLALAKALKLLIGRGMAGIAHLHPPARPYLDAVARWALCQTRHMVHAVGVHLVALSGGSGSLALEYARFVAFCRHYLLGRRLAVVKGDLGSFYWKALREACVVYGQAPSTWMLHPHIQTVDDITQRIPRRTFERMWFENLLHDLDAGDLSLTGKDSTLGTLAGGGERARIPLVVHQAQ
jgi:hypothetical protein